jgi:hypothetical protein
MRANLCRLSTKVSESRIYVRADVQKRGDPVRSPRNRCAAFCGASFVIDVKPRWSGVEIPAPALAVFLLFLLPLESVHARVEQAGRLVRFLRAVDGIVKLCFPLAVRDRLVV